MTLDDTERAFIEMMVKDELEQISAEMIAEDEGK